MCQLPETFIMPAQLLIEYLDRSGVSYQLQSHASAYTASEVAQASHIHGHNLAKAVMVKLDGELTMLVLPAHYHLDLDLLAGTLGAERAVLATESEFVHRFPRCEAGAMPPIGHLYGVQAFLASVFHEDEEVAFNACSHTLLVRMDYTDFLRVGHFEFVSDGVLPPAMSLPKPQQRRRIRV
jgi:Ala-tRNA(Pro) deacylase